MGPLSSHVAERRVIVCCGAGGVGKTTTAAAIALAAARKGRRVLALTIDPSRRLGEALGIDHHPKEPVTLPDEQQRAAGIDPPGSLSAWMLDARAVSDRAVRSLAKGPEQAERLLENRVYKQVSRMIAGMQDYTAMKALQEFMDADRYDLVVLDTPPSRNALNFLDAPHRLARFLDQRIFRLFRARGGGARSVTRPLIRRVLSSVFGQELAEDLGGFFGAFGGIFGLLNGDVQRALEGLKTDDTAFWLVTSPSAAAVEDVFFFERRIAELALPFGGFILNRSHALRALAPFPDRAELHGPEGPVHDAALEKLQQLAHAERRRADADQLVLSELRERVRGRAPAIAIPDLACTVDGLDGLGRVADLLMAALPGDPS